MAVSIEVDYRFGTITVSEHVPEVIGEDKVVEELTTVVARVSDALGLGIRVVRDNGS